MKKSRDYFALDWIKGELDQTLAAARQSLEEFALPEHDKTRMRACLTHLHQVHGTLVMLELTGVAVLADEMERLAQSLLNGEVANVEGAQQVLMQGILQLPAFLEEIQKGFPDSRRAVLPIANELRLARGDTVFSDTPTGGVVDLRATAAEDTLARFKDIDGVDKARKIRAAYQQVLLAILRGDYGPQVVGTLTKVAVGLERICEKTPMAALWRAFGVFVKSLAGEARLPGDVVKLLRRVDAEIKVLAQDGRSALARPLSTELVRSLVDAAAARGFESAELEDLGRALTVAGGGTPAVQPSGIAGNQALQTAANALREEIASVKDQLDLFVRAEQPTIDHLRQLVAPLKRIGSTLSVLGFESSRAIVVDQVDAVNAIATDGRIDEAVLMGVAAALLQVDENLTAVTEQRRRPLGGKQEPSALLDEAQLAVLAEARNGLEHVKQAIVEYVSSHWDTNKLSDVSGLLGAVRGALTMVTLTRPADLLGRCTGFVERELLTGKVPDWTTLDTFADAISGVDYYLERLCEQTSPGDDIVSRVERSVIALESARPEADASERVEAPPARDQVAARTLSAEGPTLVDDLVEADNAGRDGQGGDDTAWIATPVPRSTPVEGVGATSTHASRAPVTTDETESFELVLEEATEQSVTRVPAELEFDLSSELFDDAAEEATRSATPRGETHTPAPPLRAVPKSPASVASPEPRMPPVAPSAPKPATPPRVARPTAPPPSIEEPDEEIIEIFVEEVGEVLESLNVALGAWSADLGDTAALKEARRGFHTLKGSGRIVGAKLIGEVCWSIENLLNRVIDGTLPARPQIAALAIEVRQVMPDLNDAFRTRAPFDESIVAHISERADLLASGGQLEDLAEPEEVQAPPASLPVVEEVEAAGVEVQPVEEPEVQPVEAPEALADEHPPATSEEADSVFDEARVLFVRELRQHFDTIEAMRDREPTGEALTRALHTLRGSAAMAGVDVIDRLVSPLYSAVLGAIENGVKDDPDLRALLAKGTGALRQAVAALERGGEANADASAELDAHSKRLVARFATAVPPATPLVALEGAGVLMEAREFLKSWAEGAMDLSTLADIVAALHEVRNQAESQRQLGIVHLCDALVSAHERLEDHPLSPTAFDALDAGHELLLTMFDRIAANQAVPPHAKVIETLERAGVVAPLDEEDIDDIEVRPRSARVIEFPTAPPIEATPLTPRAPSVDAPSPAPQAPKVQTPPKVQAPKVEAVVPPPAPVQPSAPVVKSEPIAPPIAARRTETQQPRAEVTAALPADVDPEILDIFFEESDELLETIDQSIHEWLIERDNQVHLENMLRALHTLKGGARLAGLSSLGDETHAFESFLSRAQSGDPQEDTFFRALQKSYDDLTNHVGRIRVAAGHGAIAETAPYRRGEAEGLAPATPAPKQPAAAKETVVTKETAKAPPPRGPEPSVPMAREAPPLSATRREPVASEARAATPPERAPEREEASVAPRTSPDGREMVRVSAGLLEQLVNLAGESSIVRSRVEQGISDFGIALEEMETTIERVREQLRRLEIETETQVLFRHERHVGPQYEEFDPLEMDRYSHLQQLSKALSESASDMLDLKETLSFKSREAETLLIQQARINTELQEGLMRTRMVPFSRLVPRLRRIVRQVGNEVGKEVELHVYNPEGELDRNVLERMVPPLEHMLRNAIDHGIEVAELRRNFGKPDSGRVDLRLSREAGDVMIEIADDGAGIDVESVRAKAVERGLMAQDARLADDEVLQFVFAPGFSTAKSVTQISGRGVGMDVVHSTVKQLGGSIQITSVPGKGTRFTVRLPFTVSVNRALMVSVNEDLYAVPLNTIEGIVRISADQLEQMYSPSGGGFEYAGVPYRVRYLGSYIGREYKPRPEQGSVPVVLLRSGDIAMAIHVDGVAGSREIVVKSLGPQFAGVSGISGATILGDGSVVVILDLLALVRAQMPAHHYVLPPLSEKRDRPRCVMVVDDSVTVRKVTSRLLERQGMDVMVAKDGVEAIAMLQERRPDILLLDIEMPRMDGFEVARQIRHDERLAKLPIVMISSRTGAKHQEHAVELGVNRFLGKPFQESELLSTIDDLVD